MQNETFNFKTSKEQIDLVDYLASLGHHPAKRNSHEFWFFSPLHEERTASFKVDRARQIWYDHGVGQGGDLINFVRTYHHCNLRETLVKLKGYLNIQGLEMDENRHLTCLKMSREIFLQRKVATSKSLLHDPSKSIT